MNGSLTPRPASPCVKSLPWVVQKFGGTSIGKYATSIAEAIVKSSRVERRIAVVGSARSSYTKAEGTTNRLLRAADQVKESDDYLRTIDEIYKDHIAAAETDVASPEILSRLRTEISAECESLRQFLNAVKVSDLPATIVPYQTPDLTHSETINEISVASKDQIVSYGEKLSCLYLTAVLQDKGVDAFYVDASTVIDFDDGALNQTFYDQLAEALARMIGPDETRVPVVTGYFGPVKAGLLREVGRGYTDLCAALVAVGLKAEELQIWKEVDGIFSADPRKVPTARLLKSIPPAEAAELASYGSEVVHPFTMKQVISREIPIRVKNVMKPSGPGTIVAPKPVSLGHKHNLSWESHSYPAVLHAKRPSRHIAQKPTAITSKSPILVLNIQPHDWGLSTKFYADIFTLLTKRKMVAEMISTSQVEVSVALTLSSSAMVKVSEFEYELVDKEVWETINELSQLAKVEAIPGMAIVSVVGNNMKDAIAISGKIFTTLGEAQVNIEMISQGASEINVSCVVLERDVERAVNVLHTALIMYDDY